MSESRHVSAGSVTFGNDMPLVLIAGPCAMESHDHAMDMAGKLKEICAKLELGLVFKTSFDKANRTSADNKNLGVQIKFLRIISNYVFI